MIKMIPTNEFKFVKQYSENFEENKFYVVGSKQDVLWALTLKQKWSSEFPFEDEKWRDVPIEEK